MEFSLALYSSGRDVGHGDEAKFFDCPGRSDAHLQIFITEKRDINARVPCGMAGAASRSASTSLPVISNEKSCMSAWTWVAWPESDIRTRTVA